MDSARGRLVELGIKYEPGIYQLADSPEFTKVLHEEVQARGLALEDVEPWVVRVYSSLLDPWCDRNKTIVINKMDFTAEEYAALITFMKVQSKWDYALSWREEVLEKACEGNVEGR